MLTLNPVNHGTTKRDKNRFCGPAVISALTGITTGEAARRIREHTGRRQITGTWGDEIKPVFADLGVRMTPARIDERGSLMSDLLIEMLDVKAQRRHEADQRGSAMTFAAWLKATEGERSSDQVFLLTSGKHWVLVQRDSFVCGLTGDVVSVDDPKVKRRARVARFYLMDQINDQQAAA